MPRRLRPLRYVVAVEYVVDDGDDLVPLTTQPVTVSAADWPDIVRLVAEAEAELAAELGLDESASGEPTSEEQV